MGSRLDFHNILKEITPNVYYQAPTNITMRYPCIKYSRNSIDNKYGSDEVHIQNRSYSVVVMDYNPDSEIVDKISKLKYCRHTQHYVVNGLNHDIFNIYF